MQNSSASPLREFFHNKYIWIFWVIDIIAIITIVIAIIQQSTKVSKIYFDITPIDAKISVNGNEHYSNGQHDIAPGKYTIDISHDGLKTKTLSIDVEAHSYTNITTFLNDTDNSFDFYRQRNNYNSFLRLKDIASAENNTTTDKDTSAQDFIANYTQILSIADILPLNEYLYSEPGGGSTGGFSIENGQNRKECTLSACLLVRYYGKDYESAVIDKIKEANYDPNDYQIIYKRYTDD